MTVRRPLGLVAVFATLAAAASAGAVDVVIFNDGFSVQGRRFKESERIADKTNGMSVVVPAIRGFDVVEMGPKWFIFSNKTKQVGRLLDNVPAEKDLREYVREVHFRSDGGPLPSYGEFTAGAFDDKWRRNIKVSTGGGNWQLIEQRIERITPRKIIAPSISHRWFPFYDTREWTPAEVRRLLAGHPDLAEPPGKPDAGKRLLVAQFMLDVGWPAIARAEIAEAQKLIPGPWPKEHAERLDKLTADIAKAETKNSVEELSLAAASGRYDAARELVARFDDKAADADTVDRFTKLRAAVEDVRPRFETARRSLRETLDEMVGGRPLAAGAVAGGAVVPLARTRSLNDADAALADAGEQVLRELHPDTAERLESFRLLAASRAKDRAAGRTGTPPAELVALAVSGWVRGKNGADKSTEIAARYWGWRQALLDYQTEPSPAGRRAIAQKAFGRKLEDADPDVLAQIISHLPPPEPADLSTPAADPPKPVVAVRRNTGPLPQSESGVDYFVRLPAEYHHGRPYPVVLALTHHTLPAENLIALLAPFADRAGYIVVAPVWVNQFEKAYDWSGDEHYKAQAVLRSVLRHYRADNDRVFVYGFGEGANFAVDLGASHPDLFAGVAAMGCNPKFFRMTREYYPNYQKLPLYVTIGALGGNAFENLRRWYELMMPLGYPAVASVYRGRGSELFMAELPAIFDWMGRKRRVTGTAALRLNETTRVEEWQTMRPADNRFYWVGTDSIAERCQNNLRGPGAGVIPAKLYANVLQGNTIKVTTQGTKNVVVWLDRDMIDWSRPVRVQLNGANPTGYKPKVIQPDVELMLEQLYAHGDRSMLFLNKLEFATIP